MHVVALIAPFLIWLKAGSAGLNATRLVRTATVTFVGLNVGIATYRVTQGIDLWNQPGKRDDALWKFAQAGLQLLGITPGLLALKRANAASKETVNYGKLTFDKTDNSWTSLNGVKYGQGSAQGNRVKHVLEHTKADPTKPAHSIFSVPRNKIVGLIDEAFIKKGTGVLQSNGNRMFEVELGRVI